MAYRPGERVRSSCEHTFVHPASIRTVALLLAADGINDCEIVRRLGVPRTTVRDWRNPRYAARPGRGRGTCPRCWRTTPRIAFSDADYAELLGLYLGDGHITAMARTEQLRISLDAKYPNVNDEIDALLGRCFPDNRVGRVLLDGGSTVVLHVYNSHLSCLFPQAGPGKKHERAIALEPWQAERVAAAPWAFLRGCIRSDGCVFVNRTGPVRVPDVRLLQPVRRDSPAVRRCVQRARIGVSTGSGTGCASTGGRAWRSCSSTSASSPELPAAR